MNPSLQANPRLSSWISICPDGTVLVRSGKVELGQGVLTALAQIVAEELDVSPHRVRMVPACTDGSPDESYTAGSLSVQHSGGALRAVCTQARAVYLAAAAALLAVAASSLRVRDGEVTGPDGVRTSWWELADDALLDVDVDGSGTPASSRRVVGTSLPRVDVPDKVAGRARYLHDLVLPAMLHGRVLRPPSRGALLTGWSAVPGVVVDGSFVGVVAEREQTALALLERLRTACTWSEVDVLPEERTLVRHLLDAPAETTVLLEDEPAAGPAAHTLGARFSRPHLAHASIGTSCAIALWEPDRVRVWTHSQGVYRLRDEIAKTLARPVGEVVVQHVEGAGCYGHNAADDAAYDAVLLARSVPGRPVRVLWSRADELTWSPLGPAMVVDVSVDLDAAGAVQRWHQDVYGGGHAGRPGPAGAPPLLAAQHVTDARPVVAATDPPLLNGGGSGRNAVPGYAVAGRRIRTHRQLAPPLRTSALRALGAHLNVYAIESVVDELAELAGQDPVAYRLGLLPDPRARDVLSAAAERVGWVPGQVRAEGLGRGLGVARYKGTGGYCAVVADIEAVDRVLVRRLTIAVDVGLVVNPDGVVNQIEGGALQAVSWTTKEAVHFDRRRVTGVTWEDYPILVFSEAPAVDVVLLDRPDQPSVGAGEASIGPTAAAIGNALADVLGVRVRTLPLTPATLESL